MAIFVVAITFLGNNIFGSSFALNPANVLTDNSDYSQLLYADTNITCPSGFNKITNYCDANLSGSIKSDAVAGWLIVDFTADGNSIPDVNSLNVRLGDLNLSCTTCNASVTVNVFTTPDLQAVPIQWTWRGVCTASDNQSSVICIKNFSGTSVEGVLVGRRVYDDIYPDPAVYVVRISN